MALTATASSALPPAPSWDDTIVPALKRRLEGESIVLSRRISAASVTASDDGPSHVTTSASGSVARDRSGTVTSSRSKDPRTSTESAATRRPSSQQPRVKVDGRANGSPRMNGAASGSQPYTRARTKSQPFSLDAAAVNGHSPPMPNKGKSPVLDSGRSGSPYLSRANDGKPTRIPTAARSYASSVSSQGHTIGGRSDSRNGANGTYNYSTPDASPDVQVIDESDNGYGLYPPGSPDLRHQRSNIQDQQPPFNANSHSSSVNSFEPDGASPRLSTDSDERPFEHWYRGEVSRNGGVGELRVGRRQEMLDIANYGHSLRSKVQPGSTPPGATLTPSSSRRRRADSVAGIGARESFYLEEDRAAEHTMVTDEAPLTDMEGDTDHGHGYYDPNTHDHPPMPTERYRSATPDRNPRRQQSAPPSRIPGPASSPDTSRYASEPPEMPSASISTSRGGPQTPQSGRGSAKTSTPQSTSAKKRAVSPAAAAEAKKARMQQKQKTTPKRRDDRDRRSVAEYPTPPTDGDELMHAIPSWTQPVPAGDWDDVVLPVVARKKGLDDHYQQADGSPQPKKAQEDIAEPAPGTFGYDYSKYRPPRDLGPDAIPMDEFGRSPRNPNASMPLPGEEDGPPRPYQDLIQDDRRVGPRASGPPFAHYGPKAQGKAQQDDVGPLPRPMHRAEPPRLEKPPVPEDDSGAGCCKCIIM